MKEANRKLPVAYFDESANLDRKMLLLAELMALASTEPEPLLGFSMFQELSSELNAYLRARCALEVCVGRVSLYYRDDEFYSRVKGYRKKLNAPEDG